MKVKGLSYSCCGKRTLRFSRMLLIVVITASATISVAGSNDSDSTLDENSIKDTAIYDFLFIGGKFQNQFAFMGRNFGHRIPFATNDLTYFTNFNLWLSASAYHFFDNAIPFQSSVSIGYGGDITRKIDYNVSYSHFLIPATDQISKLQSLGFVQATVGLDWNILYSTLQAQVMTYSTPDYFFVSQHSRYFEFSQKLFGKVTVSFQPAFAVTLGTSRFYYSTDESLTGRGGGPTNPRAILATGGGNNSGGGDPGRGNPGNGNGNGNGNSNGNGNGNSGNPGNPGNPGGPGTPPVDPGGDDDEISLDDPGKQMGFLSWEAVLPITFQWGKFTVEYSSRYAHPLNVIAGDPSRPVLLQSVDLYFSIPVKRKRKS